jgi:hypothetical protein
VEIIGKSFSANITEFKTVNKCFFANAGKLYHVLSQFTILLLVSSANMKFHNVQRECI